MVFLKNKSISIIFNFTTSKNEIQWYEVMKINFDKGQILVNLPPPLQKNTNAK